MNFLLEESFEYTNFPLLREENEIQKLIRENSVNFAEDYISFKKNDGFKENLYEEIEFLLEEITSLNKTLKMIELLVLEFFEKSRVEFSILKKNLETLEVENEILKSEKRENKENLTIYFEREKKFIELNEILKEKIYENDNKIENLNVLLKEKDNEINNNNMKDYKRKNEYFMKSKNENKYLKDNENNFKNENLKEFQNLKKNYKIIENLYNSSLDKICLLKDDLDKNNSKLKVLEKENFYLSNKLKDMKIRFSLLLNDSTNRLPTTKIEENLLNIHKRSKSEVNQSIDKEYFFLNKINDNKIQNNNNDSFHRSSFQINRNFEFKNIFNNRELNYFNNEFSRNPSIFFVNEKRNISFIQWLFYFSFLPLSFIFRIITIFIFPIIFFYSFINKFICDLIFYYKIIFFDLIKMLVSFFAFKFDLVLIKVANYFRKNTKIIHN